MAVLCRNKPSKTRLNRPPRNQLGPIIDVTLGEDLCLQCRGLTHEIVDDQGRLRSDDCLDIYSSLPFHFGRSCLLTLFMFLQALALETRSRLLFEAGERDITRTSSGPIQFGADFFENTGKIK